LLFLACASRAIYLAQGGHTIVPEALKENQHILTDPHAASTQAEKNHFV